MIGDLPAMHPCPYAKRGDHELVALPVGEDSVLLACCVCGMARPLRPTVPVPLDDLDAAEVARRVWHATESTSGRITL